LLGDDQRLSERSQHSRHDHTKKLVLSQQLVSVVPLFLKACLVSFSPEWTSEELQRRYLNELDKINVSAMHCVDVIVLEEEYNLVGDLLDGIRTLQLLTLCKKIQLR